jgi:hypothetical protein
MNDLDKKDLLELANIIKTHANKIDSLRIGGYHIIVDGIEEIIGCADAIIEIVENKPHKIERMF